ncbi:hypothetical protein MSAN_00351800 [Mycena sanguinolenta]|uniref:Uncharacterized protein n=1 Tax=Mycena sanguinolenta TaxID=230812 RepID=A0A8H7DJJ8_9AGAR|nr:hypothetical protein MSAN_00351800 [Mycena sanguinolenta]
MSDFLQQLSARLNLHRFLGLAISHSTSADPRRLEHYNYTYWTGDLVSILIHGQLKNCLIAPQFPVYVSPKEPSDPDDSFGSGLTVADSEAQGVCVDIAIVTPIVQPRQDPEEWGALAQHVAGKSLAHFFEEILPQHLPRLSPRFLWVSGFEAPLLVELKPLAKRHADDIEVFHRSATGLLTEGALQGEAQALCLFCSSRFATQDVAIIVCGAGDLWRVRKVTRSWAKWKLIQENKENNEEGYTSNTLKRLKKNAKLRLDLEDDGDWTEGKETEMYGDPLDAEGRQRMLYEERVRKQAEERRQRALARGAKRDAVHQKFLDALHTPPSVDRTTSLFPDEALDAVHRKETNKELFESRPPDTFFATIRRSEGSTEWSSVLRLGSDISNQYMAEIERFIREFENKENGRRKTVFFPEQ